MVTRRKQQKPLRSIQKNEVGVITLQFLKAEEKLTRRKLLGEDLSTPDTSCYNSENEWDDLNQDEKDICLQLDISSKFYHDIKKSVRTDLKKGLLKKTLLNKMSKLDAHRSKRLIDFVLSKQLKN